MGGVNNALVVAKVGNCERKVKNRCPRPSLSRGGKRQERFPGLPSVYLYQPGKVRKLHHSNSFP